MTRHSLGQFAIAAALLTFLAAPLTPRDASAQVKPEMAVQFGPQIGYDLSPDALTFGAFAIVHNLLVNVPAIRLMLDAAYGIGTENRGANFDYNTFRIAVTALYLLTVTTGGLAILPVAGLAYYRFSVSVSNAFIRAGASSSDVALVLGGMLMINQLWFRATIAAGGAADLSASIGYTFGAGGSASE